MTLVDLVVACISIDFTSAGLQMTSSTKEALSSRWVTGVAAINQLVGLALMMAMLAHTRDRPSTGACYDMIWRGTITSCGGASLSTWLYIGVLSLILLHGLWLDCRYSPVFDRWEKDWKELSPYRQQVYWDKQLEVDQSHESGNGEQGERRKTVAKVSKGISTVSTKLCRAFTYIRTS